MNKSIFKYILLSFILSFLVFFSSCSSLSNSDKMNDLCENYKIFSEKTDFIYNYDYMLNERDAKNISTYITIFFNSIKNYKDDTDNVFFNRLSSNSEIVDELFNTTVILKNFLDAVIKNPDLITEESNRYFIILFNNIHNEMYSIEYDRVITSESIISDYIKYFMIFIIFFGLLCLVLLGIFIFELKQRDLKIMETSKFLDYTIKGQEEEKRRIARELHDTVAQDIRYIIQLTKQLDSSEKTSAIIERQENCLKQVRELCSSFIPQDIENKDLVASLNDIFTKIKTETNIEPKLTILDNINFKEMDSEKFLHFFRIIQEILTNAQKHSKASEISVLIKREIIEDENYIHLIITDDGIGIDKQILDSIKDQQVITKKNHFGLKNIIQRVQLLGGKIIFNSNKEFGTEISVLFKEK